MLLLRTIIQHHWELMTLVLVKGDVESLLLLFLVWVMFVLLTKARRSERIGTKFRANIAETKGKKK